MRGVFALAVAVAALAGASPAAAITPNDPTWWAAWGQRMIGMPQVWDVTTGSPNVVIASIDTGVARGIPDVGDNVLPGWDFTRSGPVTGDAVGHGTSVVTEMVARGNNGIGIAGYCWYCRVLPVRVTVNGIAKTEDIANGIRYAVNQGVRIINIGFNDDGAGVTDSREASALQYAQQRGVLVFASAGNSGSSGRTYPASYSGAYAVAATDPNDVLYWWSTRGSWVPFSAPGCQLIVGTDYNSAELCGTSVTAPVLSALAGLLYSAKPSLSPGEVLAALASSVTPIRGLGGGRIDAVKAFQAVGLNPPPPPPVAPPPPPVTPPPPPDEDDLPPTPREGRPIAVNDGFVYSGMLRRGFRMKLRTGNGIVAITLRTPKARSCAMSLYGISNGMATIASSISRGRVSMRNALPAGTYRLSVHCRVATPRPYTLALIRTLPNIK